MWYEGTSRRYTSGTKVKVICKGQGQITRSHFCNFGKVLSVTVAKNCVCMFYFKVYIFNFSVYEPNPPLNVVRRFVHLLDTSDADYAEELGI